MPFLAGIPLWTKRDRWGDSMPAPAQRVGPMGMRQAIFGTAASPWTKSLLMNSFLQPTFITCLRSGPGLHVGDASVSKNKTLSPALFSVRGVYQHHKSKQTKELQVVISVRRKETGG